MSVRAVKLWFPKAILLCLLKRSPKVREGSGDSGNVSNVCVNSNGFNLQSRISTSTLDILGEESLDGVDADYHPVALLRSAGGGCSNYFSSFREGCGELESFSMERIGKEKNETGQVL